ncbi:MAG: hypothetical protein Q8Q09_15755 [Deltaproteobacteria bacterium]|nr:hypothetical protein [Deltaproteobacteria bacterium]
MTSDSLFRPRAARGSSADVWRIVELMDMAREGLFKLPQFQRHLRWDDRDRLDLLDSTGTCLRR